MKSHLTITVNTYVQQLQNKKETPWKTSCTHQSQKRFFYKTMHDLIQQGWLKKKFLSLDYLFYHTRLTPRTLPQQTTTFSVAYNFLNEKNINSEEQERIWQAAKKMGGHI